MEEVGKLPLKRVELSLTKFNEVAIPHHLDLLRQHKANIIKFGEHGDGARVRSEQTHARRVAAQLRALLHEMDALRRQVRPEDWDRFDALTQRSRDLTLRAIVDYLGVIERSCRALVGAGREMTRWRESSPVTIRRTGGGVGGVGGEGVGEVVCGSAVSTESVGVVAHAPQLQLQHDDQELQLKEREEVLRGWCELQAEVHALHESWRLMQDAAVLQRQQVTTASESIEVAADNVQEARRSLSIAERLGAGAAALCGACAGAACGGPLGLLAGAKAAAAAALAGAALGYAAVRAVRRLPPALPPAAPNHDKIL
ncbi:unnamed protein product [Parnassius mnemosyne]|uniref:STX17-like N-terminal domain-containing protein n=1 Tax=Parnassius mnemosyne TaxID=213953 RepID=A0AAV1LJQ8_9NEOP